MPFLGICLIDLFCMSLSIKLIVPEAESVSVREYEIFSRVKYLQIITPIVDVLAYDSN